MEREDIIRRYFQAWINKDRTVIREVFAENILYSECYGPEYHGLSQVLQWFSDWNQKGSVLEWTIKRFVHQGAVTAVEWYFQCEYDHEISGFDGVSIIEFDDNRKITVLKEFQSKAEHNYPYEAG